VVVNIRGIKVAYPSNGADLKGLLKAAYYDPNPVVIFEHKGLYWGKVPGTEAARTIEPDEDYQVPFGKARIALEADSDAVRKGLSLGIVCYGMGVHWALNAARRYPGRIEVLDLRTLVPLDETALYELARRHGKVLVLTEEPAYNTFAEALSGRIARWCFRYLDRPPAVIGSAFVPAIPLSTVLENAVLPSVETVAETMDRLIHE
jgi:2-oxoisovalerate dehydrogenase E1 component